MLDKYHKEIQQYVKSKLLSEGDEIVWKGAPPDTAVFVKFPTVYCGRLGALGVEPGIYKDRSRVVIESLGTLFTVEIDEIEIPEETFLPKLNAYTCKPYWFLIDLAKDKLEDLPELPFMEGNIVKLLPSHPNYSDNLDLNQFTINRIDYGANRFKLRRGPDHFWVEEAQIEKMSEGPVEIFYRGELAKLKWRSPKQQAEFYVLLGRYDRIFNFENKSYYWDETEARKLIETGQAHAVLEITEAHGLEEGLALIKFWDEEIGRDISYYTDIILTW